MSGQFKRQEKSQRKHPIISSTTPRFGTTPSGTVTRRPDWKGPGFTKPKCHLKPQKPSSGKTKEPEANIQAQYLPVELQQLLLNIFKNSFEIATDPEKLGSVVQDLKWRLVQHDSEEAFEGEERLEAYAVKWSSSRALCYAAVFVELWDMMDWTESKTHLLPLKIVSLGGGAAEVIAFGGLLRFLYPSQIETPASASQDQHIFTLEKLRIASSRLPEEFQLHLIDNAAWQTVTDVLAQNLFKPPPLSKYASASARSANRALFASQDDDCVLRTSFQKYDILKLKGIPLKDTFRTSKPDEGRPVVITLFFTLNKLFSISHAKTTAFLLEMTDATPVGSVLLVLDSPGCYTETVNRKPDDIMEGDNQGQRSGRTVNPPLAEESESRRYPMIWLLEHVLLGGLGGLKNGKEDERGDSEDDPKNVNSLKWEKVMGDEARWFRVDEKLKYPIKLESVRFQMHVFRRV